MSYYPAEQRGGCMESISRCCRQVYVYPIDTRKLLYAAGGLLGIIIVVVVWYGLSSSDSTVEPFKGHTVLNQVPLTVGSNFFLTNLKKLAHNSLYNLTFDQSLQNDPVFGDAVCKSCQTDLSRLQKGLVGSQLWSIDVSCDAQYMDAVSLTLEEIDTISRLISKYPNTLGLTKSSSELTSNFNNNKVSSLLAVTSGLSIDGRLAVLRILYTLGVRVMALTSKCSSDWAGYYADTTRTVGLTSLGQRVVKEMNRLGIVIDLSEASHQTQLDVLNITKAPVIFSRAAAYSLRNHDRNIKDDVLGLVKQNNGLLMVTFAGQYLSDNITNISTANVVEHLNYFKTKAGTVAVGIGAEFDAEGETFPSSLKDVSTFPTLFDELGNTWSQEELKKLASGNFLTVLQAVEQYATDSKTVLQADETYQLYVSNASSKCYSDFSSRDGNTQEEPTAAPTVAPTQKTVAPANTTVVTAAPAKTTVVTAAPAKTTVVTAAPANTTVVTAAPAKTTVVTVAPANATTVPTVKP